MPSLDPVATAVSLCVEAKRLRVIHDHYHGEEGNLLVLTEFGLQLSNELPLDFLLDVDELNHLQISSVCRAVGAELPWIIPSQNQECQWLQF